MRIGLESDYKDYYDSAFYKAENNEGADIVYSRMKSHEPSKGKGLARLRKFGIQTIQLNATREINNVSKVIVYTDTNKKGCGAVVMSLNDAKIMYPNSLASEFYEGVDEIYKLLYIGKRRFAITIKKDANTSKGQITSIKEINSMFNKAIAEPIFSIDYIETSVGLLAVRLNTAEKLEDYGIQNYMTPEEVVDEIWQALKAYN